MGRDLFDLYLRWFGTGWPEAEDITALHDDLSAVLDKHKAWPDPKPKPRAHPATMIGRTATPREQ